MNPTSILQKLTAKHFVIAGLVFLALILFMAFKPYTTIKDTQEGVVKTWSGKYQPVPLTAGFHWVNPLNSVEVVGMTYQKLQLDNIGVPAQDGFKTTMNLVFTGKFIPGSSVSVLKENSSQNNFIQTHVFPTVRGSLIDGGKLFAVTSQQFYDDKTLNEVRDHILQVANVKLMKMGYELTSVEVASLDLPQVIQDAISESKVRAEQVKRQKESLQIADLKSQEVVKQAESDAKAIESLANANLLKARAEADGKMYAAEKQAAGNIKLAASVTPALIQYMDKQANLLWDGAQPNTLIMGKDVPATILNVGK